MINIYTALYPEAKPVIQRLKLKKQQTATGFTIYENNEEEIRLILTGAGALAAATAVGSSLAFYRTGEADMLVNWGSCAADAGRGKVYLCHKLTDRITDRTYYPDMVLRTHLPEASVITEPQGWSAGGDITGDHSAPDKEGQSSSEVYLHDMEAAAVYYAGSYFLAPHQMHFLKVVSDYGMDTFCEKTFIRIMEQSVDTLLEYLNLLKNACFNSSSGVYDLKNLELLCQEFHCSQTMKASFIQCIRYWTLAGIDYERELQTMRDAGELPCKDRREGKKKLEQLKSKLL